MRRVAACALALLAIPVNARAFTIESAFSDPCHEQITAENFDELLSSLRFRQAPPLRDEAARDVARYMAFRFTRIIADSDSHQTLLASLLVGVRAPDTEGHTVTNLSNARLIHANPEGQYEHALRAIDDDGVEGNETAVRETRRVILDLVDQALESLAAPLEEQYVTVPYFVEPHGLVDLEVWAPAYYVGRAVHALQDSFSHTLRTHDLRRIVHVFNYAEAIVAGHDERRDGVRHSDSMDRCVRTGDTAPIVLAAREATLDLLISAPMGRESVEATLDDWLTYEPGCHLDNDYCANAFLPVAKRVPTEPILSCRAVPGRDAPWPVGPGLGLLLLVLLRRRKALRSRAAWLVAVAASLAGCSGDVTAVQEDYYEVREPCGGELTGRWWVAQSTSREASSVEGDSLCNGEIRLVEIDFVGSIEFFEDGRADSDLAGRATSRWFIPDFCPDYTPSCEGLGDDFACVPRGISCRCSDVDRLLWNEGENAVVSYEREGDLVRLLTGDGEERAAFDYCVEDDELHLRFVEAEVLGLRLVRLPPPSDG